MAVPEIILSIPYATGTRVRTAVYWDQTFTDTLDDVTTPPDLLLQETTVGGTLLFPGVPSTQYAHQNPDQATRVIVVQENYGDGSMVTRGYLTPAVDDPSVPVALGDCTLVYTSNSPTVPTAIDDDDWVKGTLARGLLALRHHLAPTGVQNVAGEVLPGRLVVDEAGHVVGYDTAPLALQSAIDAEATSRSSAISTLQTSINTQTARTDVLVGALGTTPQGSYSAVATRLAGIDAYPGAARLAAAVTTGAVTLNLRTALDTTQVGALWVLIDPNKTTAELRKVTSISGVTIGFAPLANNHAADCAVLIRNAPEVDVAEFGAKATVGVDDAAAVQAAVNALPATGGLVKLTGFHDLATTINWKSNVALKGTYGGGVDFGIVGNGMGFRWVGNTNSKVLNLFDVENVEMSGFVIDGQSKPGLTGIFLDSDNQSLTNPGIRTGQISLHHFQIWNCGTRNTDGVGIQIGTTGVRGDQSDGVFIDNFRIHGCTTGIATNSSNAADYSEIANGAIGAARWCIVPGNGSFMTLQNIAGGFHDADHPVLAYNGSTDPAVINAAINAAASFIDIRTSGIGPLTIINCQAEAHFTDTIDRPYFFKVVTTAAQDTAIPIVLIGNHVDRRCFVGVQRRIISSGNLYQFDFVLAGSGTVVYSSGDRFSQHRNFRRYLNTVVVSMDGISRSDTFPAGPTYKFNSPFEGSAARVLGGQIRETIVTVTGEPSGGTFTITPTLNGVALSPATLAYNATTAQVQAALEVLTGTDTIEVWDGLAGGPYTIWVGGLLSDQQVSFAVSGAGLTGGTAPDVTVGSNYGANRNTSLDLYNVGPGGGRWSWIFSGTSGNLPGSLQVLDQVTGNRVLKIGPGAADAAVEILNTGVKVAGQPIPLPELHNLASLTPGLIAAGGNSVQTITVTGATTAMGVEAHPTSQPEAGLVWNAWVSTTDTVSIRITNITGSGVTAAARNWVATVFPFVGTFASRVSYRTLTTTPITLDPSDQYVFCNLLATGPMAVTLPSTPEVGIPYVFIDKKGDAGTNNVTVSPNTGHTIHGTAVISTNYGTIKLIYDGAANWFAL